MAVLRHRLTSQTAFPRHRCFFEPKGKRLSAPRSPFCMVSLIDTEESQLTVQFDGRDITYDFAELDELVLAYATTRTTSRSDGDLACSGGSSSDSPLERVGFEPVVRPLFFRWIRLKGLTRPASRSGASVTQFESIFSCQSVSPRLKNFERL